MIQSSKNRIARAEAKSLPDPTVGVFYSDEAAGEFWYHDMDGTRHDFESGDAAAEHLQGQGVSEVIEMAFTDKQ